MVTGHSSVLGDMDKFIYQPSYVIELPYETTSRLSCCLAKQLLAKLLKYRSSIQYLSFAKS
jgi:hypothetical protein